jgi:acetate kinase
MTNHTNTLGPDCILTINGGSSSIKFALFSLDALEIPLVHGAIKNIGVNTRFEYSEPTADMHSSLHLKAENITLVIQFLLRWLLERQKNYGVIKAIGHRVVHGLNHNAPERVTPELLELLRSISVFDPEHLPMEISLMEACSNQYPDAEQIACFDTSFHASMPMVSQRLPLPKAYFDKGIRRYGFHGISYEYLMSELKDVDPGSVSTHHVILAHLGSGSSLVAVKEGISIDTTMGFTPSSGVMMGSRTGDLDPGLVSYMLQSEKLTPTQFSKLVNHESGLLGVSGISGDVLELLANEKKSNDATMAIDLYCYQIKKAIGSLAAVLGGLDTIVFSGGIGENSPPIRRRICQGLEYLGIELDEERNIRNEAVISTRFRNVNVRVIKTNEERMIARKVSEVTNKRSISHTTMSNA